MNSRLVIAAIGLAGLVAIVLILRQTAFSMPSMGNDNIASVIYLSIWVALIGSAILSRKQRIAHTLQQLVAWIAIFLVIMAGYTYRYEMQDIASNITGGMIPGSPISAIDADGHDQITLIRDASGHFVARGEIGSNPVTFLVDTGATSTVLSNSDALSAGIDTAKLSYNIPVSTANGMTTSARATVRNISIGPIVFNNVQVMVAKKDDLQHSLLGMSFINRLRSFEIRGDRMILTK